MKTLLVIGLVFYFLAIGYAMSVEDALLPRMGFTLSLMLLICIYYYWMIAPAKFAKERLGQNVYFRKLSILLYVTLAMFLVILVSTILQHSNFTNIGRIKYLIDILGAFITISLIYGFILGAQALAFCEKHAGEVKNDILWIFILYLNLPIGMFFLSPRINKLKAMSE